MRKAFLALFILVQGGSLLIAQKWSATVDKSKILIGEPILFTLSLEKTDDLDITFPVLPDSLGNGFEIISEKKMDSIWSQDRSVLTLKKSWQISAYDSGRFYIPSIPLLSFSGDSIADTLKTDSFPVLVQTMPVDTTKSFQDIRNLYDVSLSWRDYIWYMIIGLSLIIIGVGMWLYFRYKRKHKKYKVVTSPLLLLSPFDAAMKAFEIIEKNEVWKKGKIKDWYTDVTDVMRQYLSRQFNIQAFEMTSTELELSLIDKVEGGEVHELIRPLLKESDFVKFAKYKPSAMQCASALANCKQIVVLIENQISNNNKKDSNE